MNKLKAINIAFQGTLPRNEPIFETLHPFNYEFTFSKSYLLNSAVGHGGWALSWIIGGLLEPSEGVLLRNGTPYTQQQKSNDVWCVRKSEIKRLGIFRNQSVRWQIQHGLRTGLNQYLRTEAEIIERFRLTSERYNRPFRQLSNEAWRASCAIGLANRRSIFCFPHMQYCRPDFDEEGYHIFFKSIIAILKEAGALVLIPAKANEVSEKLCDEIVAFD
ncbi:MAG: hypothetical protein K8L97_08000 [Anaerolineae bacterium]|nr:hypothetical protein [Anaerolineae bacterium]